MGFLGPTLKLSSTATVRPFVASSGTLPEGGQLLSGPPGAGFSLLVCFWWVFWCVFLLKKHIFDKSFAVFCWLNFNIQKWILIDVFWNLFDVCLLFLGWFWFWIYFLGDLDPCYDTVFCCCLLNWFGLDGYRRSWPVAPRTQNQMTIGFESNR